MKKNVPQLMYVLDKKVVIIDSSRAYPRNANPDIMILRQSPKVNLDRVFRSCKPKLVISDASNYTSYSSRWKLTCQKAKIPFHSTYEKGFYKIEN
jgi:competence protein ComEC